MKIKSKIVAGIIFSLVFSGCANSDGGSQTSELSTETSAENAVYTINTKNLSFEGKNDAGTVIYTASVTYPVISSTNDSQTLNLLNEKFKSEAEALIKDEETGESFNTAKQDKLSSEENDYEFPGYYKSDAYSAQYNKNGVVSFLRSVDMYMGGAHPSHNFSGETYDMTTGEEMKITDVLKMSQEEINSLIVAGFEDEAKKDPERYAGGYFNHETLAQNVGLADWYLTNEGVVFFFNEYDILPYAAGVPEYVFTYKENEDKFNIEI